VGGGARSREISHWTIGSIPNHSPYGLLFSIRGKVRDETRTPYPPQRSRVPDDAGQFGELGREGAGRLVAQTGAMLQTGSRL
jgi:hypothetical protein